MNLFILLFNNLLKIFIFKGKLLQQFFEDFKVRYFPFGDLKEHEPKTLKDFVVQKLQAANTLANRFEHVTERVKRCSIM